MNTLLIGGTNDGKRMSVPDELWNLCMTQNPDHHLCEVYNRQQLRGETTTFEVFAIQGMTGDQIIEKLIQCYSPC